MAACRGHSTVFPCTRVQCVTARSAAAGSPVLQSCCRSPGAWDRRVRSARDASGREVLDDQRLVARIQPVPGRLIDSDVQMADPRRVAEGSWALDENDAKIFGMVLNDRPVRGRGRREAAVRPSDTGSCDVGLAMSGRSNSARTWAAAATGKGMTAATARSAHYGVALMKLLLGG